MPWSGNDIGALEGLFVRLPLGERQRLSPPDCQVCVSTVFTALFLQLMPTALFPHSRAGSIAPGRGHYMCFIIMVLC